MERSPFNLINEAVRALRGPEYERPLRSFAVACCRRFWHLLSDQSRDDLRIVERFANGKASEAEVDAIADGNAGIVGYTAGGGRSRVDRREGVVTR